MDLINFQRHRFAGAVIVQAVRWYFRFTQRSRRRGVDGRARDCGQP